MQTRKQTPQHPISILIVDDSTSDRTLLSAKLHQFGHKVINAPSGAHALNYLSTSEKEVDLMILDVQMPGMDGFETALRIRELEKNRAEQWRPIIFLSGHTDAEVIARSIEAGGDDFLTKPVHFTVLKAKISAMQRIAHMRQKLINSKKQLEVQANTDVLTQLHNRRHFMAILEAEMSRARRYTTPLSIAYLDLDHFKQINDSHGHQAGDSILRSVANILSTNLRTQDNIGRIGGEEFCVCLPNTDISKCQDPCERYRLLIENLHVTSGTQLLSVTASFGLTRFVADSDDITSLLARADKALYQAKLKGRNRIERVCI